MQLIDYEHDPESEIVLNIVATYGRSLYALVIGLVCEWWALMGAVV